MITTVLFWILSILAMLSAVMVVCSKNTVYSVLWLIVVFFCISGHYILLNAQFLAIVNLIVYAGAIMVLFLFVLMLLNIKHVTQQRNVWIPLAGTIAGGSFCMVMISLVKQAHEMQHKPVLMKTGDIGLVANLGKVLFSNYVLPFEISSVLFLSAMVGAMVLGKKG